MKKPDYGDATPEDLGTGTYERAPEVNPLSAVSEPVSQALPSQPPNNRRHLRQGVKLTKIVASQQTPSHNDQDA